MRDFSLLDEVRCDFKVSEKRKKIWKVELDLIQELDRVCRKYGLRYFASNGTLLGAVRHGGFIPWDDDVDIVMPRPDYDKLARLAQNEFADPFLFQVADEKHVYYRSYARLRNKQTTGMPFRDWNREGCCNGIFIDIFPMDGCPRGRGKRFIQKAALKVLCAMANTYTYYPDFPHPFPVRKIIYQVTKWYCELRGYRKLLNLIYQIRLWEAYENADQYYIITHDSLPMFPAEYYEETLWVDFENIKISVPAAYDDILKILYGDYHQLPPPEKRGQHHTILFDPDKPYTEYIGLFTKEEARQMINNY